jgi:prepilin-type N-terminal cleavage/methylation domain-containing protein
MKMNSRKAFTMIEMIIVMVIIVMIGGCVGGVVLVGCGVKKGVEIVDEHGVKGVGERIWNGDTNSASTNAGTEVQ